MSGLPGTRCRRRVYLMRHGDVCYFDAEGRLVDPRYVELTGSGRQHALAAGEMLANVPFDKAVCSGLVRTEQTARCVLGDRSLDLSMEPGLNEVRAGRFRSIPPELRESMIAYGYDNAGIAGAKFIDGEAWEDFRERILLVWRNLLADESWVNLLLVAHGAVNRVLLAEVAGIGLRGIKAFEQEPACVNIIDLDVEAGVVQRGFLRGVNILPYNLSQFGKNHTVMETVFREYAN